MTVFGEFQNGMKKKSDPVFLIERIWGLETNAWIKIKCKKLEKQCYSIYTKLYFAKMLRKKGTTRHNTKERDRIIFYETCSVVPRR